MWGAFLQIYAVRHIDSMASEVQFTLDAKTNHVQVKANGRKNQIVLVFVEPDNRPLDYDTTKKGPRMQSLDLIVHVQVDITADDE